MSEKPSPFGLVGDVAGLMGRVRHNVGVARTNVYYIRAAVEAGELSSIPPEKLVDMLKEAELALLEIAN